jgi:hypothetical protein
MNFSTSSSELYDINNITSSIGVNTTINNITSSIGDTTQFYNMNFSTSGEPFTSSIEDTTITNIISSIDDITITTTVEPYVDSGGKPIIVFFSSFIHPSNSNFRMEWGRSIIRIRVDRATGHLLLPLLSLLESTTRKEGP